MKKIVLPLLLSAITFAGSAEETRTPIVSFKTSIYETYGSTNSFSLVIGGSSFETQYLDIDMGSGPIEVAIDPAVKNDDGSVSETNTTISCSVDAKGEVKIYGDPSIIEYFNADGCYITDLDISALKDNLDILSLAHNELSELDLTEFTNLRYVCVTDNTFDKKPFVLGSNHPDMTIIEMNYIGALDPSFDIKDYPNLQSFVAWNTHALTHIDPTNCPYLTQLSIDGTGVTTLDVTQNPYLQILNIADTGISSIDLSKNTRLTQLYCSHMSGSINTGAKLSSLDITNNTNLVYLFAAGNNLTSIDLSKNTKLYDMNLSHNKLSSIDLSNNSQLYNVNIGYNDFDFATLPSNPGTWSSYEYQPNELTVNKSYAVGQEIDLSSHVLREGTTTNAAIIAWDRESPADMIDINDYAESDDDKYYSYDTETGKFTLLREYPDSVYCGYYNSELTDYQLYTTKFKLKSVEEFGKPSAILSFTTPASTGTDLNLQLGAVGATATNPKTLYVDLGDGEQHAVTVTSSGLNNVNLQKLGNSSITIYTPEDVTLSAFGVSDIYVTKIDLSKADDLQYLSLVNTQMYTAPDMQWCRNLRSLTITGNYFSTLTLEGNNGYYGKNQLTTVDASNNALTSFTVNENMTIVDLNLSNNKLTEAPFKEADELITFNLSGNKLTEIDLSECEVLESLNVSNNELTTATLPATITSLDIRNNYFTLATLPEVSLTSYLYAPQNQLIIPNKGPGVDLSKQNVNDNTTFTWKRVDGVAVAESDIECEGGKTHFNNIEMGKVYCEMTNPAFPDFTGDNVFRTSEIEAAGMPTNAIATFTTTQDGETAAFTLTGAVKGTALYVSWEGNDDNLTQYLLDTSYTVFEHTTTAGATVKVYSYDDVDNVTVFSLRNASLSSMDASKMQQLICLNVSNAGLNDIVLPNSEGLGELILQGNNLKSVDFARYPNLYTLILSDNQLTTADCSQNANLQQVRLDNNNLTSVKFADNNKIWGLDLGTNNLSSVDLSNCTNLQQLSLYGNNLSTIDVDNLSRLVVLYLDHNNFRFTTLPPVKSTYALYTYANQSTYEVEVVDNVADMSDQALVKVTVDGVESEAASTYRWFYGLPYEDEDTLELTGEELIEGTEYDIADGVTTFHPNVDLYPVYGVIENSLFPDMYLITDALTIAKAGIENVSVDAKDITVTVDGQNVVVNAPAGVAVNIYSAAGALEATAVVPATGNVTVGPLATGIHVVTVANYGAKVAIK
jgi:hypothetical protein